MSLLTATQLAAELTMHPVTVLKWTREGRINAELKIGRSPRFDAEQVKRQLAQKSTTRKVPVR